MMIVFIVVLCSCVNALADTSTPPIICGLNETLVDVKTTCPPQSCNLAYTEYLCDPNTNNRTYDPGCDCKKNYLRDNKGNCIFNEDCPYPLLTICGDYEESCGNDSNGCINGCKCIEKYVRDTRTNGTCIYIECGYNEIASEVKQTCPPQSCDYSPDKYACKAGPPQPGCNCIKDYLTNSSGVCVPKDQCDSDSGTPAIICGLNETLVDVKTICPPQSCNLAYTEYQCDPDVNNRTYDPGCDCKKNYLRDDKGNCIFNEDCPYPLLTICGDYEESCGNDSSDCINGCKCIKNYVRDTRTNGTCIYIECGYNEIASEVKQTCPPQSCDYSPDKYACKAGPPQPGCNCIKDYLTNSSGVCVPKDQCDSDSGTPAIICGLNETLVDVKTICPPQSCNLAYTEYQCDPDVNNRTYDPGCDCKKDYLRDDKGNCIFNEDCPYPVLTICGDFEESCGDDSNDCINGCKCIENYVRDIRTNGTCIYIKCGYNEIASEVKQTCPPQSCDYCPGKYACKPGPPQPGCNCIEDYLRNSGGVCVPKEQCDSDSDDNIEPPKHKYHHSKSSSYASSSTSSSSSLSSVSSSSYSSDTVSPSSTTNTDNDSKCNGDRNATFTNCPNPCKSTCKNPNAKPCSGQCEASGCQCNPLYLLSDEGKCILPDDCPGGNPCFRNETFIYCNAGCPSNYCPQNDNRAMFACSPPYPCPSGCGCKSNHKRSSLEDDRCILASDCPPVNCTRQNEVWNSCTPPCFSDSCQDVGKPAEDCGRSGPSCEPQCVCEEGYRRNKRDICVLAADCSTEE